MPQLLMLFASGRPVFDLPLLFGSQFKVAGPGTGTGITGHHASQRLDFGNDFRETELLDLGFDLGGGFVGEGRFAEVRFAMPPPDVEAGSLSGNQAAEGFGIDSAVFAPPWFGGGPAREVAARPVRGTQAPFGLGPAARRAREGGSARACLG